jgi:hypothetical protein
LKERGLQCERSQDQIPSPSGTLHYSKIKSVLLLHAQ